mmetsp:Transcript_17723/g.41215  ORF Transcript_17723/g.41215 Transcript_17723/m.41215 type:complete len:316 (+) Transcript_17723:94-1041(+)|eukprot:CAMPEP_0178405722 /NCGR_PEP_ID=MMETSP0689_2-20121128/18545_1 /TAXON_ID=160604 /ORGANISM="Amphidinium massartii, Strain CS-259" /LENGTH=315 /DNA_ID=CAMNT_0020026745 /DNA_START=26 /DNA_END=973 /DNA_ORIENTATION=+
MHLQDLIFGPPEVADPKRGLVEKPRAKPRSFWYHVESIAFLAGVPTLIFGLVACTFAFLTVTVPALAWTLLACSLLLALFFLYVNYTNTSRRPFYMYLAILTALAIVGGLVTGRWVYETHSLQYFSTSRRVPYSDVPPTGEADEYSDAATLDFSSYAFVDTRRAAGRTGLSGHIYCVAPVMGVTSADHASFWAAGIDCCETLSDFYCGDVEDKAAKTGVAVAQVPLFWQMQTPLYAEFNRTVHQAAAAYRLTAPQDPVIVYWSKDVAETKAKFLKGALTSILQALQGFSFVAIVLAIILHLGTRKASTPSWANFN